MSGLERQGLMIDGTEVPIEGMLWQNGRSSAGIVVIHGWSGSASTMVPAGTQLAEAGFSVLAMSMRGWGRSEGTDDCGLRQPDDVLVAVEWLRERAPDIAARVGILGVSQGGQVGLLAAARGARVDAVAAWAPVTDVELWKETTEHPGIPEYIDTACADGDLLSRSPMTYASQLAAVPLLLVHGSADRRVPTAQSKTLYEAVQAIGGRAQLEILAGVGHGGPEANAAAFGLTVPFFNKWLSP